MPSAFAGSVLVLAPVRAQSALLVAALAFISACANGAASLPQTSYRSTNSDLAAEGRTIAETLCASCHSIERIGFSPHPDAKPFRDFSENYPIRSLAEAFAEGIMVGHPDMPVFQFEESDIDPLLAYIESLQSPKAI